MSDLEKAARLTLEAMGLIGADLVCDAAHHKKADRHGIGEPCPIQARWHHAFAALRQALSNSVEQPAKQEPVGQLMEEAYGRGQVLWFNKPDDLSMLYTSPQRKPWVGLAPEEREMHIRYGSTLEDIAISIEAKLKEKNA